MFITGSENHVTIHLEQMENGLSCLLFRLDGFHSSSINSDGFYVTCNEVYNITPGDCIFDPDTINITELRPYSAAFKNIGELKNYIGDRTVLCYSYAEHIFYADKSGNSCVVETDNKKHYIIESDKNFLVATNFPMYTLSKLDDLSLCNRYKAAYKSIKANYEDFNLDKAVDALKVSSQSITVYSFIYDANENAVYIYLGRDFKTAWKFSFITKAISTYKGFKNDKEFKLDEDGIRLTDLLEYQKLNKGASTSGNVSPTPPIEIVPTPSPVNNDVNSSPTNPVENSGTGDHDSTVFWILLTTLAAGLLFGLSFFLYRKKR